MYLGFTFEHVQSGGGNVAIDAARVARRLGASQVTAVYRRSGAEMPALEVLWEKARMRASDEHS